MQNIEVELDNKTFFMFLWNGISATKCFDLVNIVSRFKNLKYVEFVNNLAKNIIANGILSLKYDGFDISDYNYYTNKFMHELNSKIAIEFEKLL